MFRRFKRASSRERHRILDMEVRQVKLIWPLCVLEVGGFHAYNVIEIETFNGGVS